MLYYMLGSAFTFAKWIISSMGNGDIPKLGQYQQLALQAWQDQKDSRIDDNCRHDAISATPPWGMDEVRQETLFHWVPFPLFVNNLP